jgi:alkylglycerol monooxygenase
MVDNFALMTIKSTVGLYFIAFILIDLAAYWSHRFNHEVNVLWNRHIVHHSSEEFNLSCALRQSISGIVGIYFFLYIPMALIGIPQEVIAVTAPLHLFAQFWYHTRLINRMGFLEHIIVTPSHHRVHHAINPEYIDKNYAAIFIVWDKWFGTFQEEQRDIPPVYGVKKAVRTWNPFVINYQHMWGIIKDAWRTHSLWDKVRIWFMPTGWRPSDVIEKYPINLATDVYAVEKYSPYASPLLKAWSWFQLILCNFLVFYMLLHITDFGYVDLMMYVIFIAISIFAYTSLMDRDLIAIPAETIKLTLGFVLIYRLGSWFQMDEVIPGATLMMAAYMVISFVLSLYFTFVESRVETMEQSSTQ